MTKTLHRYIRAVETILGYILEFSREQIFSSKYFPFSATPSVRKLIAEVCKVPGQQRHNHFVAKTMAILNYHYISLALFDELIYELMKMFDNSRVFDNNSFDNVNGKYDASSCIGMKKESY